MVFSSPCGTEIHPVSRNLSVSFISRIGVNIFNYIIPNKCKTVGEKNACYSALYDYSLTLVTLDPFFDPFFNPESRYALYFLAWSSTCKVIQSNDSNDMAAQPIMSIWFADCVCSLLVNAWCLILLSFCKRTNVAVILFHICWSSTFFRCKESTRNSIPIGILKKLKTEIEFSISVLLESRDTNSKFNEAEGASEQTDAIHWIQWFQLLSAQCVL